MQADSAQAFITKEKKILCSKQLKHCLHQSRSLTESESQKMRHNHLLEEIHDDSDESTEGDC